MSRIWYGAWAKAGTPLFTDGFGALLMNGLDSADVAAAIIRKARAGDVQTSQSALPPEVWVLPEAIAPLPVPLQGMLRGNIFAAAATQATTGEHEGFMGALLSAPGGDKVAVLFSDMHSGGGSALLYDVTTKTILTEGADSVHLGSGLDDQLVVGGDVGPLSLSAATDYFERILFLGGSSYTMTAGDTNVVAGHALALVGTALGAGDSLAFDGSGERDGHFVFQGGAGADSFIGGAGNDIVYGGLGADRLAGAGGADHFVYTSAAESTGSHYDTIVDFTFGQDVLDLPGTVSGLDKAVSHGALSTSSFDADLSAALGAGALAAGHAILFTADQGSLAGQTFLVVDANGQAGYQAGEDYVLHLLTPPPADLSNPGFIV